MDAVAEDQQNAKVNEIKEYFHFPPQGTDSIAGPVSEESLRWSAKVTVGLDTLVKDFDLQGLAYYYHGRYPQEYVNLVSGMIV